MGGLFGKEVVTEIKFRQEIPETVSIEFIRMCFISYESIS